MHDIASLQFDQNDSHAERTKSSQTVNDSFSLNFYIFLTVNLEEMNLLCCTNDCFCGFLRKKLHTPLEHFIMGIAPLLNKAIQHLQW